MTADTIDFQGLWNYSDPAASEERFAAREAEAEKAARASGDTTAFVELLTQRARAQGLQRRFDDAHATLDRAEELLESSGPRGCVRLLLERGRAFNSAGRTEEARPLFVAAWEAAREADLDGLAVDAAHMVAIVETGDEAMAWNMRALEMAKTSADPDAQRWRASLLNNIGWTFHDAGNFAESLAMFESALSLRREAGKEPELRVARWMVARVHRSLGRADKALMEQRALLAEYGDEGGRDGFVHEEIAECLVALGRTDEAREHFGRALELLSADAWFASNEPARLERLRTMAAAGS